MFLIVCIKYLRSFQVVMKLLTTLADLKECSGIISYRSLFLFSKVDVSFNFIPIHIGIMRKLKSQL